MLYTRQVRDVTAKLGGKAEWWKSRSGHRRLYATLEVSFEGEVGVDEGGLSASLYQSYFGKLFAAPALCESYDEGLPLPAAGAAEEAMQACGMIRCFMVYAWYTRGGTCMVYAWHTHGTCRRAAAFWPRCLWTAGVRSPLRPSCGTCCATLTRPL